MLQLKHQKAPNCTYHVFFGLRATWYCKDTHMNIYTRHLNIIRKQLDTNFKSNTAFKSNKKTCKLRESPWAIASLASCYFWRSGRGFTPLQLQVAPQHEASWFHHLLLNSGVYGPTWTSENSRQTTSFCFMLNIAIGGETLSRAAPKRKLFGIGVS